MNVTLKQTVSITLLTLTLSAVASVANARTVPGGANQCEAAIENRNEAIKDEVSVIESTHEMMEKSRQAHAECMRKMNDIVGSQISKTNNGDGALGSIIGAAGRLNEAFDLSGQICKQITDKINGEKEKLTGAIAKVGKFGDFKDILSGASDIKGKAESVLSGIGGGSSSTPPFNGNSGGGGSSSTPPFNGNSGGGGSSSTPSFNGNSGGGSPSTQSNTPTPTPKGSSGLAPSTAPLATKGPSTWESLGDIFKNPLNK